MLTTTTVRIDTEGLQAAQDGDLVISSSIIASQTTKGNTLPNAQPPLTG